MDRLDESFDREFSSGYSLPNCSLLSQWLLFRRKREKEREEKKSTVGSMNKMLVIEIVNRRVGRDGGCWYGREGGGGGKRRRGRKCRRSK